MLYNVKAVAMDRKTRRQVGKARVERINSTTNELFKRLTTPHNIKICYESFWNNLNPNSKEIVKVIDVEEVI